MMGTATLKFGNSKSGKNKSVHKSDLNTATLKPKDPGKFR